MAKIVIELNSENPGDKELLAALWSKPIVIPTVGETGGNDPITEQKWEKPPVIPAIANLDSGSIQSCMSDVPPPPSPDDNNPSYQRTAITDTPSITTFEAKVKGVVTDSTGRPWDERIDSSSKKFLKKCGKWKPKRGVDPKLVAELTAAHTPTEKKLPMPYLELAQWVTQATEKKLITTEQVLKVVAANGLTVFTELGKRLDLTDKVYADLEALCPSTPE
jgi:hypothetical protein